MQTGGGVEEAFNCDVECVYVLSGTLEVRFQTDAETLTTGDSMTFSGNAPHTWANASRTDPCEVLWILSPALTRLPRIAPPHQTGAPTSPVEAEIDPVWLS